jgi:hypothetical protein
MGDLKQLPRPPAPDSLKEAAANLQRHIDRGDITGCVILCCGPGGEDELVYAEGGTFDMGDILYGFELWKRNAMNEDGR